MRATKILFVCCLCLALTILMIQPHKERRLFRGRTGRATITLVAWRLMYAASLFISKRKLVMYVEGLEHVPRAGPVLIAARHFHFFYDGYVLLRALRRPIHILVALDWMRSRVLRLVVEVACALADWPIVLRSEQLRERTGNNTGDKQWAYTPGEARQYLRQVAKATVRLLRAGELLVFFPEGYPNIDPHPTPKTDLDAFLPFKPGFIKLVELAEKDGHTQVAIIPAGFTYTREAKRWHVTVRFGPALFRRDFTSSELLLRTIEESVHALSLSREQSDKMEGKIVE